MKDVDRRFIPNGAEVRAKDEGRGIGGKATPFNSWTLIAGQFYERIAPEAFDDILESNQDVVGLFNHNWDMVLGRTVAGTMTLRKGEDGLYYDIPEMPKTREDVLESVQRGDVRGNSFSFLTPMDGSGEDWEYIEGELPKRTITRLETVFDLGPVVKPAYEDTQVSARAEQRAAMTVEVEPKEEPETETVGNMAWLHKNRRRRLDLREKAS